MKMKEYVRLEDGYRIKVTEKAYNLFYRKQGFMPAGSETLTDEGLEQGGDSVPEPDTDETAVVDETPAAESGEDETPAQSGDTVLESKVDAPIKKKSRKAPAGGQ